MSESISSSRAVSSALFMLLALSTTKAGIVLPLPPEAPAIGAEFIPPDPGPTQAPLFQSSQHPAGIVRLNGQWLGPTTIPVHDSGPFLADQISFQASPSNFDLAPARVWIVFGANPWRNCPSPIAFSLNIGGSLPASTTTAPIPEPFTPGTYAFTLVATSSTNVVLDVFEGGVVQIGSGLVTYKWIFEGEAAGGLV